MDETPVSGIELRQARFVRIRAFTRVAALFSGGVLAVLLALWLYGVLFPGPHQLTAGEVNDSISHAMASATPPPAFSARVYQVIRPSLVLIQTKLTDQDGKKEDALGSGVVINDGGDIMTALHVIQGATEIKVTFADGTQSSADVKIEQPENDIAILHPSQLPKLLVPAVLGNPSRMQIGDEAYAVGNPFGLYSSMSSGVISGFDRTFQAPHSDVKMKGLIQIDTAVNPGNSGGPLLNRDGQVIAIVIGLTNPTQDTFFIGIGFAMPIGTALSAFGGSPIQ